MKQVLIIHGGESFSSYESYLSSLQKQQIEYEQLKPTPTWKRWIAEQMPESDVLLPEFPCRENAVYDEWKIYFEKLLPFFGDDVRLVGHSLGAMFLAKYLQENSLPQPIRQLTLVSAGYNDDSQEDMESFLVKSAANLAKSTEEIHLFHSQDDPVVPFTELAKFQTDLPSASSHIFETKGHFNQETFPELLELLRKD